LPTGSGHRRRDVAVQRNKLILDERKQATIVPAVPEVEPLAQPRIQDVGKKGRHKPVFFDFFAHSRTANRFVHLSFREKSAFAKVT
jgi:hypothetical protein